MTVPIEALSLLVRRSILDAHFPGGAHAFLHRLRRPGSLIRSVFVDDHLISIGVSSRRHADEIAARLRERGLVEEDSRQFRDFARVHHVHGPLLPCPWLEWSRHPEGVTRAWLAGTAPCELGRSESLRRGAPADSSPESELGAERLIRLAEENGIEHWLDLQTGKQLTASAEGAPLPAPAIPPSFDGEDGRILPVVLEVMEEIGWIPERPGPGAARLLVSGKSVSFAFLVLVDEKLEMLVCTGILLERVPEPDRIRVAEFLNRVNWESAMLGAFGMDFIDGEVRYRHGVDLEGGELTPKMAASIISLVCHFTEQLHGPLMRLVYGRISAAAAAKEFVQAARAG